MDLGREGGSWEQVRSQHPHGTNNHPKLQFQGTRCPLVASAGTDCMHAVHSHTFRQNTHTQENK